MKTFLKTLNFYAKSKGMGWSMRIIMALFLSIAFGALVMPYLLPALFGAETTSSCQSPYMKAISSVVADATDGSIC
ncbi:hypothetical protein [Candidatus Nanohalovita haloferacivicina]|uniref:hypothetical protein n=1 Tax=Candidatus Nanohalovita haloferacivicina TaxID=2978046 RepID=UPI00325FA179